MKRLLFIVLVLLLGSVLYSEEINGIVNIRSVPKHPKFI